MSRFDMAARAQTRIDYSAPAEMPDAEDEEACPECGVTEWSLWQRGDSEQNPIFQCCKCGTKQER